MFSNYPNISPANTMNSGLMSGNGNGSPTSNLFPSITSLFQSPIGTPRVTPTPQQFAAYLFNEEQFHSLIFPSGSSMSTNTGGSQNCNDAFLDAVLQTNILSSQQGSSSSANSMISNFVNNSELSNNLSPLPLFSNLITTSLNNMSGNSSNHHHQQQQQQHMSITKANSTNESDTNNSNANNSSESKSNNILLSINN